MVFQFFVFSIAAKGQKDTIDARIVLIGDAGQFTNGHHPVVDAVRELIQMDAKTTVLYSGDNLYRSGFLTSNTVIICHPGVCWTQISVADNTPAKIYMIPGNHDWENGKPTGWSTVIREQQYVDHLGKKNVYFYPKNGCPGPVEISVTPDVTLVYV